jgi:hypothetical protein
MDESDEGMRNLLGDTSIGLHRRLEDLAARPCRRAARRAGRSAWRSCRVSPRRPA